VILRKILNPPLYAVSPQKYATGCELQVNKQYVETRSKYRGRGIMSHEERGITQQKERVMRDMKTYTKM
jgi:hypothetical protein